MIDGVFLFAMLLINLTNSVEVLGCNFTSDSLLRFFILYDFTLYLQFGVYYYLSDNYLIIFCVDSRLRSFVILPPNARVVKVREVLGAWLPLCFCYDICWSLSPSFPT